MKRKEKKRIRELDSNHFVFLKKTKAFPNIVQVIWNYFYNFFKSIY